MLDTDTKRRIDTARDILVGKAPDPKSQFDHGRHGDRSVPLRHVKSLQSGCF
jgi:hypothetical protein